MLIREIYPTLAVQTGYLNNFLKDFFPERNKSENEQTKKILDEENQKIQPIYSLQGKVISHDGKGRKLDVRI